MKRIWGHIKAFLKDEEGQTSMEYILILALVAVVIMKLKGKFEEKLTGSGGLMDTIFDRVNDVANDI